MAGMQLHVSRPRRSAALAPERLQLVLNDQGEIIARRQKSAIKIRHAIAIQAYLDKYPQGQFVDLALGAMKREKTLT